MERWVGKVAMVTGASSGIGKAISEKLVEAGVKVIGVARRQEQLENIAENLVSKKGKFYPLRGDVSKEEDILEAFKYTKKNVGPVSILINNAGLIRKSFISESSTRDWVEVFNVNVLASCIAAREAIKHMKESNIDGHIVYMNSIAGHRIPNLPKFNNYTASKYAITALSETLRLELSALGSKIKVTSLSPGNVGTEVLDNTEMTEEQIDRLKKLPRLETEDVANATLFVLSTPKHVQIPELTIQPVGERA